MQLITFIAVLFLPMTILATKGEPSDRVTRPYRYGRYTYHGSPTSAGDPAGTRFPVGTASPTKHAHPTGASPSSHGLYKRSYSQVEDEHKYEHDHKDGEPPKKYGEPPKKYGEPPEKYGEPPKKYSKHESKPVYPVHPIGNIPDPTHRSSPTASHGFPDPTGTRREHPRMA